MDLIYWHKQTADEPLFPDMLWNRPENRLHAGKLLIIGGNSSGFKAPADAYRYAVKAGIGTARILLPDSLRKVVGEVFLEVGEYAPTTPSGSFSYKAFADFMMHADWSDGVILAGDFGRNSETAQLLEYFISKFTGQITVAGDALDYFVESPDKLLNRPEATLVCSLPQLQKIAQKAKITKPITSSLSLQNFVTTLHELEQTFACSFIVDYQDYTCVASEGKVSTTVDTTSLLELASSSSVWRLQNPTRSFESLTMSVL